MARPIHRSSHTDGCRFHPETRCVECPEEACLYDNGGLSHEEVRSNIEVLRQKVKQLRASGMTMPEICRFTGASKKAVEHYLYGRG